MFEDNEKNIQEVLMKYAKDMSAMCNMIANILRTLISEEKVQNLDSEDKYAKMLCLIHKAFLESTDIGKQARNGNPNASVTTSGMSGGQ